MEPESKYGYLNATEQEAVRAVVFAVDDLAKAAAEDVVALDEREALREALARLVFVVREREVKR